ncbi:MAG: class I adenylate-forming enzyme family protein [Actinomycetota bacterium]|nr:class I adenylate-forming enzyme family protein [Actinomycetota bacterium]
MLPGILADAARRFGDRLALQSSSHHLLTYSELDRISDEVAVGLSRRGLSEGSVLLLSLPSGLAYVVAYLAGAKLGVITAGANPRLRASERAALAETAAPDLVLATRDLADGIPDSLDIDLVLSSGPNDRLLADYRVPDERPALLPVDPDRAVCICFTSGSTGDPKAALFTNRQLGAIAEMDRGGGWGDGGHLVVSTALAHVGAMTKLGWQLAAGTTLHLIDRWDAGEVLALVDRYQIPAITGVAAQIALILGDPTFDDYDFTHVEAIVVGGGPSPPDLVTEARRQFGAPYSNRYSSTESGGIGLATALNADDEEALRTVGRPRPGVTAEVRDDAGNPLGPGEVGELWLRTASAMTGYWRDPQATDATIVNGWLRSGDFAQVDERGCYRLAGRVGEMYIRGGYNVHPQEVEGVLSAHQGVNQIAIVPREDPVMGEIGVAVVVPADPGRPPTLNELAKIGRTALATYKIPEDLIVIDALPLNSAHKVDRRRLTSLVRENPDDGNNLMK